MYNKTIIRFGFCDIQNNRGLGKGYQPQPSASADTPLPRPRLFWISQKPHPIIVYNYIIDTCPVVDKFKKKYQKKIKHE